MSSTSWRAVATRLVEPGYRSDHVVAKPFKHILYQHRHRCLVFHQQNAEAGPVSAYVVPPRRRVTGVRMAMFRSVSPVMKCHAGEESSVFSFGSPADTATWKPALEPLKKPRLRTRGSRRLSEAQAMSRMLQPTAAE